MMVTILSIADKRHMTPSSVYEKILKECGIQYDIICSQKYSDEEDDENISHVFKYKWKNGIASNKLKKIRDYICFRRFAIGIIRQRKYDFIIVWNENTSALFSGFLRRNYKNRYCVNIRDTVFDMGVFQKLAWPAINNALFCTRPWVVDIESYPKETYSILNKDEKILEKCKIHQKLKKSGNTINLLYMGLARIGLTSFKKIMDAFGNDKRFNLHFYGVECDTLIGQYAKEKQYNNIFTGGIFPPEKTSEYLDRCDAIINFYGTNGSQLKFAIGVKASYGPFLNIPQIVDPNTYWSGVCEENHFGYSVKNIQTLPNEFYEWYMNLDEKIFFEGCKKHQSFVDETNEKFYKKCKEVLATITHDNIDNQKI